MLKQLSRAIDQLGFTLDSPQAYPKQAAVLVAITNELNPQVVLTLRSTALKRHSGEVSFPGGWWDKGDLTLAHTALREAHEEVDLASDSVELIGAWRSRFARGHVRVQPVVGVIAPDTVLVPNPGELDAVFKVPLSFFLEDRRVRTDVFTYEGIEHWIPAYQYEGFEIWGFTAGILVDLLNKTLGAGIEKMHATAPMRHF